MRSLFFCYGIASKEGINISKNFDNKNKALVNEEIQADRVLVIDSNGENLGQMSLTDAIKAANADDLDLVCVAPNAKLPVCRFLDYRKYCYDLQRKARESKKNQKIVVVKEIRVTPVIGENDFEIKIKNCKEFLADDNKVKVTLYYPRGKRRLLQMSSSRLILDKFVEAIADCAVVDSKVQVEGKVTAVILSPKKLNK